MSVPVVNFPRKEGGRGSGKTADAGKEGNHDILWPMPGLDDKMLNIKGEKQEVLSLFPLTYIKKVI